MDKGLTLIATYTYPHEAVYIQSALDSAGIRFFIRYHSPLIANKFYAKCEQVKNIYVDNRNLNEALKILRSIIPDHHIKNRCTQLHTKTTEEKTKPEPCEKRFCFSCYAIMFSALGLAMYAIIQSIQCLF